MLFFIIPVLIFLFFTDDGDIFGSIIGGLGVGLILWYFIGGCIGYEIYDMDEYISEDIELCSFKDNTTIEGVKYLFSGKIDEKYVFKYVINTEYGKQVKELTNSNDIYIKEIDRLERASMKIYRARGINGKWYYKLFSIKPDYEVRTVFEVPSGTVTQEYNIDLE